MTDTNKDKPSDGDPSPAKVPLTQRASFSYLLAGLLVIGLVGWFASGELASRGQEDAKSAKPISTRSEGGPDKLFRVAVRTFKPEYRRAELTLRGRTLANQRVKVASETAGVIASLEYARGDAVAKGQTLCQLETGSREAKLAEAKALVAQAQADFDASSQLAKRGFSAKLKVAADKAKLDTAKAAVKEAQVQLNRTKIIAPFDGLVEEQPVEAGSYLQVGGHCATLVSITPLRAVGAVPERDVEKVSKGQEAIVRLVTGQERRGTVTFISPASDASTRTFRVEVQIPNQDGQLKDGITADIVLPLEATKAHRLPPSILSLADDGTIGVRMVDDTGTVRFRPVKILSNNRDGVWVDGLPDTSRVITVGQEFVAQGQKVEAVPQSPDTIVSEPAPSRPSAATQ